MSRYDLADSSACSWDTVPVGPAGAAGALVAGSLVAGWLVAGAGALVAGAAGALVAGEAGELVAGEAGLAAGWLPADAADAMPPIPARTASTSTVLRTRWRLRGGVGVWSGLVWVVVVSDMVIPLFNR